MGAPGLDFQTWESNEPNLTVVILSGAKDLIPDPYFLFPSSYPLTPRSCPYPSTTPAEPYSPP